MFDAVSEPTETTTGTTADLCRCVMLTDLPGTQRAPVLRAIRAVRAATTGAQEMPVEDLRDLLATPTTTLRTALGDRATQILSDARRGLRAWDHLPRRRLALSLAGRTPTLADAIAASEAAAPEATVRRVRSALEAFARHQGQDPGEIAASCVVIDPALRRLTPEALGVNSVKSLKNKVALIRAAVSRVDLSGGRARVVDETALSSAWRAALAAVAVRMPRSAKAPMAILKRLARDATAADQEPTTLDPDLVVDLWDRELAGRGGAYREKLRAACKVWNEAVDDGLAARKLDAPPTTSHRQADVRWASVPAAIRMPVDARLSGAVSARAPASWADLVPDAAPDYLGLGVDALLSEEQEPTHGKLVLEPGTVRNWRCALARCWRAAVDDPAISPKPTALEELYDRRVVVAMIASARAARRKRLEMRGGEYKADDKGRYEHSLVEALQAVGRALGVDAARLDMVRDLKLRIDPAIVGQKRSADGGVVNVYAARRIGRRHAEMLQPFGDPAVMRRYLSAPDAIWDVATESLRRGAAPTMRHVALARTALILRIGMRCGPLRRSNFARLRFQGDDAHLMLPVGDGAGSLTIPPNETKTLKRISVAVDARTVQMLKMFIATFRPVACRHVGAATDNPHLFPGAAGQQIAEGGYGKGYGYYDKSKLNIKFTTHVWKYQRIRICMHVMRHLAGKLILDQDPSAMSLVQHLLGHSSVRTTAGYYAEVSDLVAQSRYLALLDEGERRAVGKLKFGIRNG